ncbi:Lrp/AsnC family transcriptional regulator [Ornithinimicrobium sediminis]|uniref:Lrp/AsnC family transcriptional regulator n=1 Tax=Ornithinimicrobium sediminis TaxID=2904603 RepID=UPI001E282C40|nr:Lrp/AsnC family transcriptional regulator [Ornithinimicrobium sediminis]
MSESQTSTSPRSGAVSAGRAAVDETDLQIIAALQRDGRMSVRALAEEVHVSRAGAYARLERLQDAGVITGFTALVDPEKVGLKTSAYISVSIEQNSWRQVAKVLQELPGVERVALVGAEFDVLVQVRARDNHELRDLVLEQIQALPGVKGTRTWLIFEESSLPGLPGLVPGGTTEVRSRQS